MTIKFIGSCSGLYKVLPPPILFLTTPLIIYLNYDWSKDKFISSGKLLNSGETGIGYEEEN